MIIFLDLINIKKGGAVQVGLSVIHEFAKQKNILIHCFVNGSIFNQIDEFLYHGKVIFHEFTPSTQKLVQRRIVERHMRKMEAELKPDVVFTLFGPSYWQPSVVHVSGFADGWCYNPNSLAWETLGFKDKLRFKVITWLKVRRVLRSNFLIVETDLAKKAIVTLYGFPESRIFTVGNTYNHFFNEFEENPPRKVHHPFKLLVLSAYYPHKNLNIIRDVVKLLSLDSSVEVEFVLTLPDDIYNENFSETKNVINVGPVAVEDCRELYKNSDALFLPTLLETFTANYPEAMKMGLPIITSNLDFARYVCGEAALYFDPLSPEQIAVKIKNLVIDPRLREVLIARGFERLLSLETPESRAEKYLEILKISAN